MRVLFKVTSCLILIYFFVSCTETKKKELPIGKEEMQCQEIHERAFYLSTYSSRDSLISSLNELNQVLSLCGSYLDARVTRGAVYFKLDSVKRAVEEFEHLTEHDPDNYNYYFYLGSLYLENGDSIRSNQTFKQGLEVMVSIYDTTETLENYLGLLYYKLFVTDRKTVLQSLDSLLVKHPEQDSVINFTRQAVLAFDKKSFLR